jgi:subtilisin family serine protease
MSLGGSLNASLNNAVTNSIADGVSYAVAAGNSNANACNFSPAAAPNAITVGATGSNDARASFSNFGTCVDIWAPGVGILSAYSTSNSATATLSGTSMASPHVAGAAARVLQNNPTWTPLQVRNSLVSTATPAAVGPLLFMSPTG